MLQKYFPVLSEVNSPLASLIPLQFSAAAAEAAIAGISNEVLESLLVESIASTEAHKKEVEVSASELEVARKEAKKTVRTLRYRAAIAARKARAISKVGRQVKAVKKHLTKASLKGLSGLSIEVCRVNAANAQAAVRTAANNYSAALEAVSTAIEGGDVRSIRSAVAALKAATRTLEVRHIEFKFAREMLSIALARHSA